MILRFLTFLGSGLLAFIVHMSVYALTGSPYIAMIMTGVCAFSLGIAAQHDGFWPVDKRENGGG